ncbi:hypothetical protein PpBr36_05254 [Pyricularia pennisetigena]|uniref:hypothetical protein n=1 Tax=Pyricularia pennisetigena TaxID=1578925 RepID=UPI001153A636|nr:hypothetical protein PpBr36_05254 [Pyricularia pennisetigena]TLS26168.1 hypothetical protein PpBr36_05254 [Pyricularia pennisetigena]
MTAREAFGPATHGGAVQHLRVRVAGVHGCVEAVVQRHEAAPGDHVELGLVERRSYQLDVGARLVHKVGDLAASRGPRDGVDSWPARGGGGADQCQGAVLGKGLCYPVAHVLELEEGLLVWADKDNGDFILGRWGW